MCIRDRPYSYQQEILDRLDAERTVRGYNRNLVVAATGTGKTVISALDYKRFCRQYPGQPCRLPVSYTHLIHHEKGNDCPHRNSLCTGRGLSTAPAHSAAFYQLN